MTITVLGHLCLDVIHHSNGEETKSYGGIFFSLATLASLLPENSTVFPVFGVGKADYDPLVDRLSAYHNVDTSGIYRFNAPTNQVHLVYKNQKERVECSKHIAEPIPWKKINPYLETEMILVNMISGFDITLETLDSIRMLVRDRHLPVYMDIHSLTLGIAEDYTRFHRPIENWRRWLFWLHAVQMNENEAACITPEQFDEETFAKQTLSLNTKALLVTRGANGFTVFIDEHKFTRRVDEPGIQTENAIDSTGCGDVFAAAYCTNYLTSRNILTAARFANRVAAFKAQSAGSTEIDRLSAFRLQKPIEQERAT